MGVTKQPLSESNAYGNTPTELQKLEILTFTKLFNRNKVTIVAGIKWFTFFFFFAYVHDIVCLAIYVNPQS